MANAIPSSMNVRNIKICYKHFNKFELIKFITMSKNASNSWFSET